MDFNILISDGLDQQGISLLESRPGFRVDVRTDLSPDELFNNIADYDALVIQSSTRVSAELLAQATRLKIVARAGANLDNVDINEATRRGVVVMNTPEANSIATAEHAIGLIMALHRHIPQAVASMKEGKWEKKKFQGREIAGRTLGVIGLGVVGRTVCRLASRGLKMQLLAYDPTTSADAAIHVGAKLVSLDELLVRSDAISVHVPLTDETRGLLDAAAFGKMKRGVLLVNCSGAGVVDEAALLAALESEKVAAAAIDVYPEVEPRGHPLLMHPRVVATPHLRAATSEAQVNMAVAVAEQVIDYLERGVARNVVNVPSIEPSEAHLLQPYLDLARRLAQFAGPLVSGPVTGMEMQYQGEIAGGNLRPITNAALVGLLRRFEGAAVNAVNADVIAGQKGISVSETTVKVSEDFPSSLVVRITCQDGTSRSVQGALIQRTGYEPRITAVDRFITEAVPSGAMLVVTNRDIPGVIAGISGVLAKQGINIAQMNLSRESVGGTALSIINVDEQVDDATIQQVSDIEGILSVKQVVLDGPGVRY
ncbi:MAG: phosphoglycerate dehydrogenase [Desulfomonile sp.]|nr:phosphoglycerate dehydrogenase [Desulfomonile sp.]